MPSTLYALIDCNNFYVSCERAFDPRLQNKPVVILSNNDGCVISRSNEAKKLGICMGEPYFKIRDLIKKHKIAVLSSNFTLYGDLSARIMSIISKTVPDMEVYSIDEAFVDLTSMQNFDIYNLCSNLAAKIKQYTGVPVSIGIANSKTLAKAANFAAKKSITNSIYFLDSESKTHDLLKNLSVREIWGIGRQLEKRLHSMAVYTALDLIQLPDAVIKQAFNIMIKRTILELKGVSCINGHNDDSGKKQIMVSRSFGQRVISLQYLQEALATHASKACEKLRKQNSVAGGIYVFLQTSFHDPQEDVYRNSLYIDLPMPSFDTRNIIKHANICLHKLFCSGYRYKKIGIILCDLRSKYNLQADLFEDNNIARNTKLMNVVDLINQLHGAATLQFAVAGLEKPWQTHASMRSKNYTSSWDELPNVKI